MADANVFLRKGFEKAEGVEDSRTMTIEGTINRTGILMLLVLAGVAWTWNIYSPDRGEASIYPYILIGGIVGSILAFITIFKPAASPYTAPLYALAEGLFLGGITVRCESVAPGVALNAFLLTGAILFIMLALYRFQVLRATPSLVKGIVAATCGIGLLYFASMIMGFFGIRMPLIYDSGWVGIGFSLLVVGIAAFNLIIDFNFIEEGAEEGQPRYMEWYGAFGLMVTLIWLYLEIFRLLMKLNKR